MGGREALARPPAGGRRRVGAGRAVLVAGAADGRSPRRGVAGAGPGDDRRGGPAAPRRRCAVGRAAVRRHRLERHRAEDGRRVAAGAHVSPSGSATTGTTSEPTPRPSPSATARSTRRSWSSRT